ncbi:MAG: type II toxin-antitoxin system VapB family antitoxin [Planctomycetia bacterium]
MPPAGRLPQSPAARSRWRRRQAVIDTCISFAKNRCMRTTLNIDEKTLAKAARLTGVRQKTQLVRLGLEALIARESARELAARGGSEPRLRSIPRRRPG